MIASPAVKERSLHQKDELRPILELAPVTRGCNSFLNKSEADFACFAMAGRQHRLEFDPILFWQSGGACPGSTTPSHLSPVWCPFVLPTPKASRAPFLSSSPPREKQRVAVSNGSRPEIWGLVYYMLNRALNYWWLLPSLTAFLKSETWANKHVSWKSPYSDRSWQEKKHPGFMSIYY